MKRRMGWAVYGPATKNEHPLIATVWSKAEAQRIAAETPGATVRRTAVYG